MTGSSTGKEDRKNRQQIATNVAGISKNRQPGLSQTANPARRKKCWAGFGPDSARGIFTIYSSFSQNARQNGRICQKVQHLSWIQQGNSVSCGVVRGRFRSQKPQFSADWAVLCSG
jgi:hypothetical protein